MQRPRLVVRGCPIAPAPPPRQEPRDTAAWPQATEHAAVFDEAIRQPHLVLIALRTSSSIPIHGDDASAVHNYLKDMGTIKSNGEAGADSSDDDPLHLRTLLLDGGYCTSDDMGCVTTMETRVSLRPRHPSGKTWATVRASGCATNKQSRERLAKLAMVASLFAQGFATSEWNSHIADEPPGYERPRSTHATIPPYLGRGGGWGG